MKTLVVYDSVYGNTEKVAKAVSKAITKSEIIQAGKTKSLKIKDFDLIIVCSPTHGGRPSKDMKFFLNSITSLKCAAACFDTRTNVENENFLVRVIAGFFGYASPRIAKDLQKKGGKIIVPPEGFLVKGTKGPLEKSELERASKWGKRILKELSKR